MNLKQKIESYNRRSTLLLVSPYPKKGELYSSGTSGIASYAKNVITPMNRKVIVLADYTSKPEWYEEENTLVIRCYKLHSPLLWFQVLNSMRLFTLVKNVLVQFDFAIYGDIVTSAGVLVLLGILKLCFYSPSIVLHHVVTDIKKLSGHVGLTKGITGEIKTFVYNTMFHLFYKLLNMATYRIIVLEEVLKQKLSAIIPASQIVAIPHGVDTQITPMQKSKAREKLGIPKDEFVILFFGFINWFKGADFFADTFKNQPTMLGKKSRFIIAGGESPTMKDKSYYNEFYNKVMKQVGKSKSITVTGYVPQEDIRTYFSACDIVVFPYRHFMTASGVLSLTFSYKKPFIVSDELSEMFTASDFSYAFNAAGLTHTDFVFDLSKESCIQAAEKVLKNGIKKKMTRLTEIMRDVRSYQNTAVLYESMLFYETISVPGYSNKIATLLNS